MIGNTPNPRSGFHRETDAQMPTPDILFLNGTSSSGKTTLSKLLQDQLEDVFLHVPLDAFGAMFPPGKLGNEELCSVAQPKLFAGFYGSIAALVGCGNRVIVDTVAFKQHNQFFQPLFAPFRVVYVGVKCPLGELERREKSRGDRTIGLASSQFAQVHQFLHYDVEVDTHAHPAHECAAFIKRFLCS